MISCNRNTRPRFARLKSRSMGMARGGFDQKIRIANLDQCVANGLLLGGLSRDDERQVAPVFSRQLQHGIDSDLVFRKYRRERRDNAGLIFHSKPQIIGLASAVGIGSGLYSPRRS